MTSLISSPDFGKADLSNCEREQIHLAGSIQPFGALLLLREPDLTIVQASANAEQFLGVHWPLLGRALASVGGNLCDRLSHYLDDDLTSFPIGIRCRLGAGGTELDALVHRPAGGGLIVELERGPADVDLSVHLQRGLTSIVTCPSLPQLCDEAAAVFRTLTGYDRVMVYRFDEHGHGQVLSECKRTDLEAFLGNWYPASDIPQIARRLYERNRVRLLVDVAYEPVALSPRRSPLTGEDLDMSMCLLRSMSPLHIQYLKNMGVCATLVASLMVGGKLWGLVSCHHYSPRSVSFEVRAVCELLAESVATRVSALDAFAQAQAETFVRRLEQRMVDSISRAGDWRGALFDGCQAIIKPLDAQGAALLLDGDVLTEGEVPGTQQIRAVGAWLKSQARRSITAVESLRSEAPDLHSQMCDVGGFLAVPISDLATDYLIWFRPERIKTVTWGGNPTKPFIVGSSPLDLSPRRSFAQWHELVDGTCDPWTAANLRTAQLIGETVADVVLQFRSVRMLIAQDQVNSVGRQIQGSEQPVIIADARGQVLLTNDAFNALLDGRPAPSVLADLALLFAQRTAVTQNIELLMRHRRPWRGEAVFGAGPNGPVPLLVRADPVLSAPGRVLGFVVLLIDASQQQAVASARRRFQDTLDAPYQSAGAHLAASYNATYQSLLSSIVENAQVAALEIADGYELARVPETLEAIRGSVHRASEILGSLVWHSAQADEDHGGQPKDSN